MTKKSHDKATTHTILLEKGVIGRDMFHIIPQHLNAHIKIAIVSNKYLDDIVRGEGGGGVNSTCKSLFNTLAR